MLHAQPRIEQLEGIFIAKPLDANLQKRAQQIDRRNTRPYLIFLERLPEYQTIADYKISQFAVSLDMNVVISVEIRFKAEKGHRERLFAWIKEQTNIDPTEFEDGRFSFSQHKERGYVRTISLGSYIVGNENREYTVTISNQRVQ